MGQRPAGWSADSVPPPVSPVRPWLLAALPVVFLAVFLAWPLASVLARSVGPQAWEVLTLPRTWRIVGFTALQALLSTALALAVGLPAAFVLHRYRLPGRRLLLALVTVPFVLPTVVTGLAFRAVLPTGVPGTLTAILVAHTAVNLAVVVRVVGGLWGHLDPRYEQAARSLGATPWQAFRSVTWPLLRPAVVAAGTLVLLFTFTTFGIVLVLGGPRTTTLEVEVYRRTTELLDLPGAAALSVLQLLLLGLVLLLGARLQARDSVRQRLRVSDEVLARPSGAGAWALVVGVLLAVVVLVVTPLAALVAGSFRVGDGWGLQWWARLTDLGASTTGYAPPLRSLGVSLAYATVCAVLATVVGGLAAMAVGYARPGVGGRALDLVTTIPLGTSAVTLGFGLFLAFSRPPLDLRGTWVLVPLAHTLVALPLVLRTVLPVLRSVDPRLRQVAATLGAPPRRAWRTVDLPLLGRALAVGAGFAFAVSLGEFGATAFLARSDTPTLPIQVVRLLNRPGAANYGSALALATILMIVTVLAIGLTELVQGRRPGREVAGGGR